MTHKGYCLNYYKKNRETMLRKAKERKDLKVKNAAKRYSDMLREAFIGVDSMVDEGALI